MDAKEYGELREKYDFKLVNEHTGEKVEFDGWDRLLNHIAFLEFDAALEEYGMNDRSEWNGGRDLMGISAGCADAIIDNFIRRFESYVEPFMTEQMRNAIQDETGLIC